MFKATLLSAPSSGFGLTKFSVDTELKVEEAFKLSSEVSMFLAVDAAIVR